ncbi:MAG TPA: hypothetical protein PKL13_02035 [bacterium]|nr:hypothetical protein [bacterium]
MGGDVNVLTTLDDNVVFLQHIGLISQACADTLKANWNRGNISKTLVISGNRFDAEVYGGVSSSKLKVVIGTITIGTGFDSQFGGQPASAWLITAEDLVFNRLVDMYWFQTGLNGKTQCNNVCLKFRPRVERVVEIPTEPVRIEVQVPVYYPVPEYYETIIRDTVEVEAKPFCKINGWVSHSQDHFSDKPNDHFIWSLMGNVRVKCGFESSAITTSFDWGYQDGPIDWNWRIGGVKSWNHRTWFEMGCEFRYYEFTHYWWLKRLQSDSFGRLELGPYIQWDQFLDRTGKDHVEMYIAQDVRPLNSKLGTSEIKGSIKLEPNPWYLFLSGSYRFTPGERIDSLTAPKFKHSSWEPRVGIQIGRNTIFFLRHRGINHYQFQDGVNEWSDYKRRDLSLGVFYRPQTFLGIPNLYWEFICGYSKITEKNQNPINNNEDELLELKLTGFWNWKF